VLIWRDFAHYLNDDIVKTYIQIVESENLIDIPPYLSLFKNLVKDFQLAYVLLKKIPMKNFFRQSNPSLLCKNSFF
jgi:hypothetical protein